VGCAANLVVLDQPASAEDCGLTHRPLRSSAYGRLVDARRCANSPSLGVADIFGQSACRFLLNI